MSDLFTVVPGAQAIVSCKGVFKQCDVYECRGVLFAKYGGGYVKLNEGGGTSKPDLRFDTLSFDGPLWRNEYGYLLIEEQPKSKLVAADSRFQITNALPAPD